MTAQRRALEDAVVTRLSALKQGGKFPRTLPGQKVEAIGGYLHTVATYAGDLTPTRQDEEFQRVTRGNLPAVLVTTGDGNYDEHTMGRRADLNFTLDLLIASSNLRGLVDSNRGDDLSTDPGVYQIVEDIREQLFRRELGVDGIGWLLPMTETIVLRAPDRSVWHVVYNVQSDISHIAETEELDNYTSIHNEVNFPAADPGAAANPVLEFDNTLTEP